MSKLNKNAQSKLSTTNVPQEEAKKDLIIPEKIMSGIKKANKVQTFVFKGNDQERIKKILYNVQNQSQKKLTATDILRGLLILGEQTDTMEMAEAVKKSFLE
jgi:hypothetical protein